jgi:MFS family permease
VRAALRRAVGSLAVPNYRRYFAGQVVSVSGNWMQMVAEMWLILKLTNSGVSVGLTLGLQFVPILLLGAWGGLVADRFAKRRVLMITQPLMALPALALWLLTAAGTVAPWMVFALVLVRGTVNAFDNPARQSFVIELVGPDRVVNAVSLNSVVVQSARIIGPAIAGTIIALAGVGPCFALNALSFAAMFVALRGMNPGALHTAPAAQRAPRELRAAVRYVAAAPALWIPLGMMVLVGTLSFNFQVIMPLLASQTWHGTAATYGLLTASMAAGSVVGALAAGARGRVSARILVAAATGFGVLELLAAVAPSLPLQVLILIPLGAVSVTFSAGVNSTMQLAVTPAMRGRVMALYSVVFLGSTPIGAPFVGWLSQIAGPRAGMALGGAAALAAAGLAAIAYRRSNAGALAGYPVSRLRRLGRASVAGPRRAILRAWPPWA